MRSIEYYCSNYFDPRDGQELSAPQFLARKISAGLATIEDLIQEPYIMNEKYMDLETLEFKPIPVRDGVRIRRIANAIDDWKKQYNELYGIETEIE